MDLVATVTQKQGDSASVDVWRLNGQRVCGVQCESGSSESTVDVVQMAWRSDGQILAVACSDSVVRLVNVFSGKIAHRLQVRSFESRTIPGKSLSSSQQSTSSTQGSTAQLPITILSWITHFSSPDQTRRHLSEIDSNISLDDLLGLNADIAKLLKAKADLPKELASLDVEISLPKLATLPATGGDDDVFSTRNSIDTIFHSSNQATGRISNKGDAVDALIVGFENCSVHLQIFDSFEIGSIDVSSAMPKNIRGTRILQCASHPFISTYFLLVEGEKGDSGTTNTTSKQTKSLHLISLDLRFIPQTSYHLPLLATKATQLQNLLRYLSQIHTQLTQEIKAAFDLPTRFLRNVNESLNEQDEHLDFDAAAYHLIVTGECHPRLKEWLVDEVGERGLKRWDKAVGDCLDTVRRMVSECLLPAVERCQVVLSRLDGMSRFGLTATRLGVDERSVRNVRETFDVLGVLGEDLLCAVCLEMREFACFMRWFKWEAEVEALEETSERAEELRETYTGEAELRTVLDYISGAMSESRILKYVDGQGVKPADQGKAAQRDDDDAAQFYATYKKHRNGQNKDKKLPGLGSLLERLQRQSDEVFFGIAETLRKSILTTHILELPFEKELDPTDSRIVPSSDPKLFKLMVVAKDKEAGQKVHCTVLDLTEVARNNINMSTNTSVTMEVPEATEVLDVKFVDDTALIVLASTGSEKRIYGHDIDVLSAKEKLQDSWKVRHVFDDGGVAGMDHAGLQVNGRKGRRVVAVVDGAGIGYVIFDVDSDSGNGDESQVEGEDDEVMRE